MDKELFGSLLTVLRKKQGISQKDMAEMLSVSASALNKWEHGKNLPDMTMLNRIAEIFQVSCDDLHNPEATLRKLEAGEAVEGQKLEIAEAEIEKKGGEGTKERNIRVFGRKKIFITVVIGLVLVLAAGAAWFYRNHGKPSFEVVDTRYNNNQEWGYVYEMAVVAEGKIEHDAMETFQKETVAVLNQEQEIEANIVMFYYYDRQEDALAWKETQQRGGSFLNGE